MRKPWRGRFLERVRARPRISRDRLGRPGAGLAWLVARRNAEGALWDVGNDERARGWRDVVPVLDPHCRGSWKPAETPEQVSD